jgi:fructose-bisphosphate aldolase class 1
MSTHAQEMTRMVAELTATSKGILALDESSRAIEKTLSP